MKNFYLQAIAVFIICLTLPCQGIGQDYHPMPSTEANWKIIRCWSFYPGGWYEKQIPLNSGFSFHLTQEVCISILIKSEI